MEIIFNPMKNKKKFEKKYTTIMFLNLLFFLKKSKNRKINIIIDNNSVNSKNIVMFTFVKMKNIDEKIQYIGNTM
jgi:hypothetical protein